MQAPRADRPGLRGPPPACLAVPADAALCHARAGPRPAQPGGGGPRRGHERAPGAPGPAAGAARPRGPVPQRPVRGGCWVFFFPKKIISTICMHIASVVANLEWLIRKRNLVHC